MSQRHTREDYDGLMGLGKILGSHQLTATVHLPGASNLPVANAISYNTRDPLPPSLPPSHRRTANVGTTLIAFARGADSPSKPTRAGATFSQAMATTTGTPGIHFQGGQALRSGNNAPTPLACWVTRALITA